MELLFPIIGFLLFEWSFLIIVLFWLVDQFGNQINFFARLRFVQTLYLPKNQALFPLAILFFCILFIIELGSVFVLFNQYLYDCQTSFLVFEINEFLRQELWLFLPLLVVASYLKDKMTFYKTDLPYQESPQKMVLLNMIKILSVFILIACLLAIWLLLKPPFIWLIVTIAVIKLLFDSKLLPWIKLNFFKKI